MNYARVTVSAHICTYYIFMGYKARMCDGRQTTCTMAVLNTIGVLEPGIYVGCGNEEESLAQNTRFTRYT